MSYTNWASRISWQFFLSHHSTACLQKNSLTHQRKTPAKTNVCCYSQSIQKLLCDAIAAAKSKELARPKSIPQWHQRLLWLIFSTCLFFFLRRSRMDSKWSVKQWPDEMDEMIWLKGKLMCLWTVTIMEIHQLLVLLYFMKIFAKLGSLWSSF